MTGDEFDMMTAMSKKEIEESMVKFQAHVDKGLCSSFSRVIFICKHDIIYLILV